MCDVSRCSLSRFIADDAWTRCCLHESASVHIVVVAVPYPALAGLAEQSAGQFDDEILVDVSNPSTSPPSTPARPC
jgi:hypothetical protein